METIAVVEREEKQARDLKRGDWTAMWHVAKVLYAEPYIERGRERVLVVYRDPYYLQPEVDRYDGKLRVPMAVPEEIPEDPDASGRELDDEPGLLPSWVEGHHETGRTPS
ncbi:MAG TPA: hypothetical protein VGJ95_13635 [Pseudonocardiaceae bacterium]|jgi:hypothetical protein